MRQIDITDVAFGECIAQFDATMASLAVKHTPQKAFDALVFYFCNVAVQGGLTPIAVSAIVQQTMAKLAATPLGPSAGLASLNTAGPLPKKR